jgi:hypothetical protein
VAHAAFGPRPSRACDRPCVQRTLLWLAGQARPMVTASVRVRMLRPTSQEQAYVLSTAYHQARSTVSIWSHEACHMPCMLWLDQAGTPEAGKAGACLGNNACCADDGVERVRFWAHCEAAQEAASQTVSMRMCASCSTQTLLLLIRPKARETHNATDAECTMQRPTPAYACKVAKLAGARDGALA